MPKPLTVWIKINCGKFWKRWEYLTYLLRNLYAGQEATVRTGHGTTDWFQIGKGVCQGCILSPCLFNFYAEYIIWNARLDEAQAGIKIAGRNINNLRYADDTILMTESEELKSLLMKVKEESEKVGLKLNIRKMKIMASHPITSWQMMGKQWKEWETLFSWAPKSLQMVTTARKLRCLFLRIKIMTKLDSILQCWHYFANKGLSSQSYCFSSSHVWMWELHYKESWVPKNWCFWTVVFEKILESPSDCEENQPVNPKGN